MFQLYLNEFSSRNPKEFKIIVLDNGAFHKAKSLQIPPNIALLFLPPYSPELNPAEKIWAFMKRKFTNKLYRTLDEVTDFIQDTVKQIEPNLVKSTCAFKYILDCLNWTM
jgi:transposase